MRGHLENKCLRDAQVFPDRPGCPDLPVQIEAGHDLGGFLVFIGLCFSALEGLRGGKIEPGCLGELVFISGGKNRELVVDVALVGEFAVKVLHATDYLVLADHIVGAEKERVAVKAVGFLFGCRRFCNIFQLYVGGFRPVGLILRTRKDSGFRNKAVPAADGKQIGVRVAIRRFNAAVGDIGIGDGEVEVVARIVRGRREGMVAVEILTKPSFS